MISAVMKRMLATATEIFNNFFMTEKFYFVKKFSQYDKGQYLNCSLCYIIPEISYMIHTCWEFNLIWLNQNNTLGIPRNYYHSTNILTYKN